MVRHLLDHGHRRVAIIKGIEENYDAQERLRGYRAALESVSAEKHETLEFPGSFSETSGYEAARRLLALSPRPTALFASNDSMAIGALSALRDAGVDIPGDIALAGFDDIPIAAYLSPSLTSVHLDISNLGALAIRTLLHAVRQKNAHTKQQLVLPTSLSIRESCGCARVNEFSNTDPFNNLAKGR
jgi:LacI family transcriptional regulator